MRFPHKGERVVSGLTHHHNKVVAPRKLDMMSFNCSNNINNNNNNNNNTNNSSSGNSNNAGIPVGFRFHPTDEELVGFYLFGRITTPPPDPREEDLRIIRELDLYRHEPWDLSEVCKIPGDHSVNQNNWYFFSHKDKKYPTGNRANRATKAGFWKATGRDKCIQTRGAVGMRKTLVFYRGRAPHGQKTDWIMHEFRLDVDGSGGAPTSASLQHQLGLTSAAASSRLPSSASFDHEGAGAWVVCRVFRKTKNLKSKTDCTDTPTTSVEEDPQMALLPEITDSTEKFSSDEGEHVDYPPSDHFNHPSDYSNYSHHMQHCKQELLSINDYAVHHHNSGMLVPSTVASTASYPMGSNYNTFLQDPLQFEHQHPHQHQHQHLLSGMGCTVPSSSSAGMFSPLPSNSAYMAMLGSANSPIMSMLDVGGLDDFRFAGSQVPLLDQSLTDLVNRPALQQLQQQVGELLSSSSGHDNTHINVSFGLPCNWVGRSASASASGACSNSNQFEDFCHSSDVNASFDHQQH